MKITACLGAEGMALNLVRIFHLHYHMLRSTLMDVITISDVAQSQPILLTQEVESHRKQHS
jgi:hypothetical protein